MNIRFICVLFILRGFQNNRGISVARENSSSPHCLESGAPILEYITVLKKEINAAEQKHSEVENENAELKKKILEISYLKAENKAKIDNIERLRSANENLRKLLSKFAQQQSNIGRIEGFIIDLMQRQKREIEEAKLNEAKVREDLKDEIKKLRYPMETKPSEIEMSLKKDLKSKIRELETYKAKGNTCSNQMKELNSQVVSYKKDLTTTHTKLTAKTCLLESNSKQLNRTKQRLDLCKERIPKTGCKGLASGIYMIAVNKLDPFSAFCNGDIEGGGWIVIQKQFDGSVDFNRTWTEYREGFGNVGGEFFIGLEKLHSITNSGSFELYMQLGFFNRSFNFAAYDNFSIGSEDEKYELKSLGRFRGTAPNNMNYHLNQKFSTFDQDNDPWVEGNCAITVGGGWWYQTCSLVHFNGKYHNTEVYKKESINWGAAFKSLKSAQMLIRPKSKVC
ncbi:fibrinogen-like protein 1 [Drosophila willistoni]|nr:fibrinogen-like protein 1 [Drosophila willistoni]